MQAATLRCKERSVTGDSLIEPKKSSYWETREGSGVSTYRLQGHIVNQDECLDAGFSKDEIRDGSMNYLVNDLNGRIIKSDGGGHCYIRQHSGFFKDKKVTQIDENTTYIQLENAIKAKIEDVTSIIVGQVGFGKSWG